MARRSYLHRLRAACCSGCLLLASAALAGGPWTPQASLLRADRIAPPSGRPAAEKDAGFEAAHREGARLLAEGQYERARPHLDRAIELAPRQVEVRLARARTLLALGYLGWRLEPVQTAREDAAWALWLEPERPGTRELLDLADHLLERLERVAPAPSTRRSRGRPGGRR